MYIYEIMGIILVIIGICSIIGLGIFGIWIGIENRELVPLVSGIILMVIIVFLILVTLRI